MAYTLIGHGSVASGGVGHAQVNINLTGADLVLVAVGYTYGNGPILPANVSDDKGNTYVALTNAIDGTNEVACRVLYTLCANGAPVTNVQLNQGISFPAIAVAGFSGRAVAPLDQQVVNGTTTATSIQPGLLTPSENNTLVVTALGTSITSATLAVTAPFTLLDQVVFLAGTAYSVGLAIDIQTTATARNPTWSGFNFKCAATSVSFKALTGGGGGGGAGTAQPLLLFA